MIVLGDAQCQISESKHQYWQIFSTFWMDQYVGHICPKGKGGAKKVKKEIVLLILFACASFMISATEKMCP